MKYILFGLLAVSMMGAASAQAPSGNPKADPSKDKLICKREVPVGSLIASRKRCMTKAQWAALERDGNEEARKMIYDNAGRPTGN